MSGREERGGGGYYTMHLIPSLLPLPLHSFLSVYVSHTWFLQLFEKYELKSVRHIICAELKRDKERRSKRKRPK